MTELKELKQEDLKELKQEDLKELRENLGLSHRDIAAFLHRSPKFYKEIEDGKRHLSANNKLKLKKFFNTHIAKQEM